MVIKLLHNSKQLCKNNTVHTIYTNYIIAFTRWRCFRYERGVVRRGLFLLFVCESREVFSHEGTELLENLPQLQKRGKM